MKALLFCQNPYAFGILGPLALELAARGDDALWYVPENITGSFPFTKSYLSTSSIRDCIRFSPEAIFVPGNEVPHYLNGVKVQIFHGFAGEKKGHFRIRHYFDLYLTQGPWFTDRFMALSEKYKNFEVRECGWSKLDPLYKDLKINHSGSDKKVVLYAPTFSPSLTSATEALDEIINLSKADNIRLIVKFHDLMAETITRKYYEASLISPNLEISEEKNILPLLKSADIMISDTSSAVYEFLLLDKPVVTIASKSTNIKWANLNNSGNLRTVVLQNLNDDPFKNDREWIRENYHPYSDGLSSLRMIEAAEDYIKEHGVPTARKLPLLRERKMNRMFGKHRDYV